MLSQCFVGNDMMMMMMGHSPGVRVPWVGFGASFHFTNDLYSFESLSLRVITAGKVQGQAVFLTAGVTLCFDIVIFAGVFVILLRRSFSDLVKLKKKKTAPSPDFRQSLFSLLISMPKPLGFLSCLCR